MLKKLSEEKLTEILETGIAEFAAKGSEQANINVIAKKSGVSVGVLYKYYTSKDGFFEACLRHSLSALESTINDVLSGEEKILARAEKLIRAVQHSAKTQSNYNILYHEITAGRCKKYAPLLVKQIEGISSKAYGSFIAHAQEAGDIRSDMNPRLLAFFFDSLLMMLQFSYCCEYYRERFKIYCGDDILSDDERVVSELLKFFESAFTLEQAQITHTGKRDELT